MNDSLNKQLAALEAVADSDDARIAAAKRRAASGLDVAEGAEAVEPRADAPKGRRTRRSHTA